MDLGAARDMSTFGFQLLVKQAIEIPFINVSFLMKCLFLLRSAVECESY